MLIGCAASIPVWWLNAGIWALALVLFLGPVSGLEPLLEPHVGWWWLVLGFLVAERCVVHLRVQRNAHSFSLGDVPLVFGLVLAGGAAGVPAVVGPALRAARSPPAADQDRLQPRPVRAGGRHGHADHHDVAAAGTGWAPRLAIAVLIGAQVSAMVCVALIGAAISLCEGWLGWLPCVRMFVTDLAVTVTNTSPRARRGAGRLAEPWACRSCWSRCSPSSSPTAPTSSSASATSGWSSSTRPTARCRARRRSPRRSRACWPGRSTRSGPSARRSCCGAPTSRPLRTTLRRTASASGYAPRSTRGRGRPAALVSDDRRGVVPGRCGGPRWTTTSSRAGSPTAWSPCSPARTA